MAKSEIRVYYIVSGTGTMVTGGEFVNKESRVGLLGPNNRGEIRGGVLQYVEPGDIAIIPKGMPHSWHKIDTDTISYIIFRADPNKVMDLKNE
jgi:mannose-6-phosphate isomerase-like protein (cupin superfamily)